MTNDPFLKISQEKKRLRRQIERSKRNIVRQAHELVSPVPQAAKHVGAASSLMAKGVAIVQGARLGVKAARAVRKLFGRK